MHTPVHGVNDNNMVSEEQPMGTTIQRNVRTAACSSLLLLSALGAAGQSTFQNLGFENTTITVILINPSGPYYATNATVPGWAWSPHQTFGYGDPNTTVTFDGIALDSSAVTLHGTDSCSVPRYSREFSPDRFVWNRGAVASCEVRTSSNWAVEVLPNGVVGMFSQ